MTAPQMRLPDRLMQVLEGLAQGKTAAQISRELEISRETVRSYTRKLYLSLGVHDRGHAVAIGYQRGLLGGQS
jgi:DNA-binding NarL/FixJ family response regulator